MLSDCAHRTRNSNKLKCLVFCSWGHFQNGGVNMEARWCTKRCEDTENKNSVRKLRELLWQLLPTTPPSWPQEVTKCSVP